MRDTIRITVGTVILAPILAAFFVTGFPAQAATQPETATRLSDPRVSTRIDRSVKDNCRRNVPGSVEYSVCLAEGRKNAYRAAAERRNDPRDDGQFTLR